MNGSSKFEYWIDLMRPISKFFYKVHVIFPVRNTRTIWKSTIGLILI